MRHLICAAIAALAPALAPAQDCQCFARVGQLLGALQAGTPQAQQVAHLYLSGVSDAGQGVVHCAPASAGSAQLVELLGPVLRGADPDQPAAHVVLRAMLAAWPCGGADKPL